MIKKKIYTTPETSTVFVVVENILQGLQKASNGEGWTQTITDEDSEGTDADARTNISVWDEMGDSF